jgi:hypothetical protein
VDPVTIGLAIVQGAYFAGTGLWALFHVRSFMRITGAKTDVWLVKTVAALVLVIGCALAVGAARGRVGPDLLFLAVGSTTALAAVDLVYVAKGTIARVYLLDALIELLLAIAWIAHVVATGFPAEPPFATP